MAACVWQLGASFVLDVLLQLAVGVAHMHSCGILHRDLKADNALIQSLDPLVIKWGDYGCAVQLGKKAYGDGALSCRLSMSYSVHCPSRGSRALGFLRYLLQSLTTHTRT